MRENKCKSTDFMKKKPRKMKHCHGKWFTEDHNHEILHPVAHVRLSLLTLHSVHGSPSITQVAGKLVGGGTKRKVASTPLKETFLQLWFTAVTGEECEVRGKGKVHFEPTGRETNPQRGKIGHLIWRLQVSRECYGLFVFPKTHRLKPYLARWQY